MVVAFIAQCAVAIKGEYPPRMFAFVTGVLRRNTRVSTFIYSLTDQLNAQWRDQLRRIGSVFQNYMLVGTQWGASITSTPDPKVPSDGVPSFLSNSVVETYLQTLSDPKDPFGTGSCVSCHRSATLPVDSTTPADLSFLPDLVTPGLVRRAPIRAPANQ